MDWQIWAVIIAAVAAVVAGIVLVKKGLLTRDKLLALITTATRYIRKAEQLFPQPGSGSEKKSYVLGFLTELFQDVEDRILGALIDMLVAILNAMSWW